MYKCSRTLCYVILRSASRHHLQRNRDGPRGPRRMVHTVIIVATIIVMIVGIPD